jgi:hypothetical protein
MLRRGSEISIVTGYGLNDREVGFDSRYSQEFSLFYIGHTVVLYGCETRSLTLREEHRLRVFENRVLRRIFGP